ncbi:MAG TPA: thiamine pyrophosphate-dependent enzyme [Vicinamibacterales bacterium]|nr:thiamine pyrophosphate-dependent enzyme [Vicinamibacterales bacterium]
MTARMSHVRGAVPRRTAAASPVRQPFLRFVAERYPCALEAAARAFDAAGGQSASTAEEVQRLRPAFARELNQSLSGLERHARGLGDVTPRVSAERRLEQAIEELVDACDGALAREAIALSLTADERREMLRGMLLTRATDNRLKAFFTGGEIRYGDAAFQGKGFRSLGQEAIYASAIRLRRGAAYRAPDGSWRGDVVAPVIRDLGAALAMRIDDQREMVRRVLSAQMAKAGPPMDGKDLHIGDFSAGILPATAPLAIGSLTLAGMALAFAREESPRIVVSYIGEGGTSLGEWHEAINACAARRLPAVFCVQNNQTALSTPVAAQSAARVFAEKATGYGIPAVTIDGTDPDAIAAAFAWAASRAREGRGPSLIELVCMRMCGHAHHDDMLYLGREPQVGWSYPSLSEQGYADLAAYEYWSDRDPVERYAHRLEEFGLIASGDLERWKADAAEMVEDAARAVIDAPWPEPWTAGARVLANEPPRHRVEVLDPAWRGAIPVEVPLPPLEPGLPFDKKGRTFLDAVMLGIGDALRVDPRVFVYGEDVGGRYGNAFLMLRPLLEEFGDRLVNSPLAEGAVLGVCVGAALAGLRPIGEIQFNDFVATGFNQLVNNAAKIRYRWGADVPMVVRMPWGGLRHAGPYHSQNTEAWFYRTPGLKIVAPSTPEDARSLLVAAVLDPDPVLFYEHIALYRDPRVKQALPADPPAPRSIGKAALRRAGDDLAIITYGAYVHVAMRVADRVAEDGINAAVLDLRSLAPLDREAVLAVARHCSRVLIVHEDTRTGSIGESVAAIIQEEAFEWLDAPVRILGALDSPVPYSPPLEEFFLPGESEVERAVRLLAAY